MADRDMRESAVIKLDFPFDFDGERITEITMRRAKMRDKIAAEKIKGADSDKVFALIANLVERPKELLVELDEVDFEKVQEQYLAFTGRQESATPMN